MVLTVGNPGAAQIVRKDSFETATRSQMRPATAGVKRTAARDFLFGAAARPGRGFEVMAARADNDEEK